MRADILHAQTRELVARLLDEADPLTLDQALDEAARLAGEVFDAAGADEREAFDV